MAERRLTLHAYISPEAHSAWQAYAEDNGVSITGLLEVLGLTLAKEAANAGDATEVRQDWVKAARTVDAQRRRRGSS